MPVDESTHRPPLFGGGSHRLIIAAGVAAFSMHGVLRRRPRADLFALESRRLHLWRASLEAGFAMTIGPKPLDEFTDRECELIEEAAAEGNAHLVVLGEAIAAILPGQHYSSGPFEHVMFGDPLD